MTDSARPVALVTGATGGIGWAIAHRLACSGFSLALAGRRVDRLEKLVAELGGEASSHEAELTENGAVQRLVGAVLERHGRLDLLVNNAGIGGGGSTLQARTTDWQRAISVNLTAAMDLAHASMPSLLASPQGCVVHIASISARVSYSGGEAYAASKAGLVAFSSCLFESVREQGVKVCAILPGYVDTEMVGSDRMDRSRMIQPNDVADAVMYAVSSSATCCPTEIVLRPQRSPYR